MRDILLRAQTPDVQTIHTALAEKFLAPGHQRDFLFSPTILPDGGFGAWVRIGEKGGTQGREVNILPNGSESDFLLRAFAAGRFGGKKRSFPVSPKFDDARIEWLKRQGETHGFSVIRASFTLENVAIGRSSGEFGFNVTIFSGRLKVNDAAKFESALRDGIGTRRGYGCGMLLLFPDGEATPD